MQSFNIFDMWGHMGLLDKFVVTLLGGMSMYSIWVMIDRFIAFRKARDRSRHFLTVLRERLKSNAPRRRPRGSGKPTPSAGRAPSRSRARRARTLRRVVLESGRRDRSRRDGRDAARSDTYQ